MFAKKKVPAKKSAPKKPAPKGKQVIVSKDGQILKGAKVLRVL